MAAVVCICPICGSEFIARRRDKMTCGRPRCRKAFSPLRLSVGPPEHEPIVVAEIAAGRFDYLKALDWLTDPVGARELYERQLAHREMRRARVAA
jgi:hypothetical protein